VSVDEELDRRRDQEEGEITPDRIERLRRRIGLPQPFRDASFEFASVDVLRNYARCICEIDPLYRDADYARATAWGSFAAQPTFLFYMVYQKRSSFQKSCSRLAEETRFRVFMLGMAGKMWSGLPESKRMID